MNFIYPAASNCDLELIWKAHTQMVQRENVEEAQTQHGAIEETAQAKKQLTATIASAIESTLTKGTPHSWTKDKSVSLMDRLHMALARKPPATTQSLPKEVTGMDHPSLLPLQMIPSSGTATVSIAALRSSLKNPQPNPNNPTETPPPNTLESTGIKASSISSDELALFQKLRQQVSLRSNAASGNPISPPNSIEGAPSAGGGLSASQAVSLLMQRQPSMALPSVQGNAGVGGALSRDGQNPHTTTCTAPGGLGSSAILHNYLQQQPHLQDSQQISLGRAASGGGVSHSMAMNSFERRPPSTGSSLPPPAASVSIKAEPSVVDIQDQEQKRMLMLLEQRQSLLRIQQQQRASQKDALGQIIQGGTNSEVFGALALAPLLSAGSWKQPQQQQPPLGFDPATLTSVVPFHPILDEGFNIPSVAPAPELQISKTSLTSPKGSRAKKTTAKPQSAPNSGGSNSKKANGSAERQNGKKGRGSRKGGGSNSNGSPSSVSFMDVVVGARDFPMASPGPGPGPSPLGLHSEVDPSNLTDLGNLLKNQGGKSCSSQAYIYNVFDLPLVFCAEYLSWLAQRQALATHPPPHYNPSVSQNLSLGVQQQHQRQSRMAPPVVMTDHRLAPVQSNAAILRSSIQKEPSPSPLLNVNGKRRSSLTGHGLLDGITGLGGLDEDGILPRGESLLLGLEPEDQKRFSNGTSLLLDI